MEAPEAKLARPIYGLKPLWVSFQAFVLALLVGFGAFAAVLGVMVSGSSDEPSVPQDLFLVGVNLPPLGFITYIASSIALYFGVSALQWTMVVILVAFVAGLAFLWFEFADWQSYVDRAYMLAMLLPGVALIAAHWLFVALRSRRWGGKLS